MVRNPESTLREDMMLRQPYYLTGINGKLRFTRHGRRELGPYFAMAGIDINVIKTEDEYFKARRQASPYFLEWLKMRAGSWPNTEQFQLLKSTLMGKKD